MNSHINHFHLSLYSYRKRKHYNLYLINNFFSGVVAVTSTRSLHTLKFIRMPAMIFDQKLFAEDILRIRLTEHYITQPFTFPAR